MRYSNKFRYLPNFNKLINHEINRNPNSVCIIIFVNDKHIVYQIIFHLYMIFTFG